MSGELIVAIFTFVLLIFSISFHECAHAWSASKCGDQTARMLGRVTLNPMYHVDPIGTLLLPAIMIFGPFLHMDFLGSMLIGWGKPTPVNPRNFRKIVRDDNLVSMAGPASNLLLCMVFVAVLVVIRLAVPGGQALIALIGTSFNGKVVLNGPSVTMRAITLLATQGLFVNISLCVFNLMPIPPLDGSHVVRNLLPYNAVRIYDRIDGIGSYALMLLFARFIVGPILVTVIGALFFVLVGV